jgi:hypothetical protein
MHNINHIVEKTAQPTNNTEVDKRQTAQTLTIDTSDKIIKRVFFHLNHLF